jgi:aspartyl-tRNA(Asn)/glutamyl-tRNA(Gln) amidotransferase subunit A
MKAAMAEVDILLCACQPAEAGRLDVVPKWSGLETEGFTLPFNVSGYPAISLRAGFGAGGLPVSVQLAAKPFAEATLFHIAHALEQATEHANHRPKMPT